MSFRRESNLEIGFLTLMEKRHICMFPVKKLGFRFKLDETNTLCKQCVVNGTRIKPPISESEDNLKFLSGVMHSDD